MLRQRLRANDFALSKIVGRALVIVFALALAWYGAMLCLLALGASPSAVNDVSGYRDAYDYLAALRTSDISPDTRLIIGMAGLATGLSLGYLAWRELPRPYLARGELELSSDDRGRVDVSPRAIERAAEAAALEHPAVIDARALYGTDALTLEIAARGAGDVPTTLTEVQERAAESLTRHELPVLPINLTLTRLDRKNRRELA